VAFVAIRRSDWVRGAPVASPIAEGLSCEGVAFHMVSCDDREAERLNTGEHLTVRS